MSENSLHSVNLERHILCCKNPLSCGHCDRVHKLAKAQVIAAEKEYTAFAKIEKKSRLLFVSYKQVMRDIRKQELARDPTLKDKGTDTIPICFAIRKLLQKQEKSAKLDKENVTIAENLCVKCKKILLHFDDYFSKHTTIGTVV